MSAETTFERRGVRVPGRPRDPSRDRAILEAALELLAEEGYGGVSMEAVAHRAGVGKPTVYRRWPSKAALVVDAVAQLSSRSSIPAEGTVRERLTGTLAGLMRHLRTGPKGKIMAALVAELPHDPELARAVRAVFLERRRESIFLLLQEGIANGELRPDLDLELAADQLVGPVFARHLITGGSLSPGLAPRIVEHLFDGWAPRPA